jgi:hypothetical protein
MPVHKLLRMNRSINWISTFMLLIGLSGCLLVPFVDAFKKSGATESDRMALLAPEVQRFTEAIGWGNRSEAMSFVVEESRKEISSQFKKLGSEERIVDSKVDDVEWINSAWEAKVAVKVQYYMVPYYVVKTRLEDQHWIFSVASGWKLKQRSISEG